MPHFSLFFILCLLLGSCVSQKKYLELEESKNFFQDSYESLRAVKAEKEELEKEKRLADASLRQTMQELEQQSIELERLKIENADLTNRYNSLISQNKEILSISSSEKQNLEEALAEKQLLLNQKQQQLSALEYTLSQREANVNALQESLSEREGRINDLESLLAAKDAQMQALRDNINNALRGFTAADLTVTERNGKIYVSLSQDLLFQTGSDNINFKGKNAIRQLATALNQTSEVGILVEGHTDDTGDANFNWDLSVKRATAVVKELVIGGVEPSRVTAAGRAFYAPLVPNNSDANRALNRRTDIILSPKLDQLYDIIRN